MSKDPIVPSSWTADSRRSGKAGDALPRWLFIAAVTAAVALALALLRFAIDLLGLVLVLVLVGFSIRALSDWLSDDDSLSGWSLLAVGLSLAATVAVGLWLFDSRRIDATGAIQRRLPSAITRAIDWAERRGWGQRILLPRGGVSGPALASTPASRGSAGPALAIEIPAASPSRTAPEARRPTAGAPGKTVRSSPTATAGRATVKGSGTPVRSRAAGTRQPPSAIADRTGPTRTPDGRGAEQDAPAAPVVVRQPPTPAATRTLLTAWPAAAVVGTSVRLTARVESDSEAAPSGSVVFRLGDRVLGTARLRPDGSAASGFIVVLDLPVGEHVIVADYAGDERHAPSRSAPVRQPVVRR
jgi:hypothetical protein